MPADVDLAREIVERLNALVSDEATRVAVQSLISERVRVDDAFAESHPTIQCSGDSELGFLGLLNGIIGARQNGWGFVAAEFDDNERLTGFCVLGDGGESRP